MTANRFEAAACSALNACPSVLYRWLPGGKVVGQEYDVINPLRDDHTTGSFRVNIHTGKWADFATDAKGGDLVSLYAYLNCLSQSDALEAVEQELGVNNIAANVSSMPPLPVADTCLMPVPDDALPAQMPHERQYWPYYDEKNRLLGYVIRFDSLDGKKEFRPLTYWAKSGWQRKSWPRPAPLFNCQLLAARLDAPVMVAEGEKAAVAGQGHFPDFVVVTWPGGTNRAKHANWATLQKRRVWLLPDADEPGKKAMQDIAEALQAIAEEIHMAAMPPDLPKGWDIADAQWGTTEEAEAWLASLEWTPLKTESQQDARFNATLNRANGHSPIYTIKKEEAQALAPFPVPVLNHLEKEILSRVPLRCALAARVTTQAIAAHLAGRQVISSLGDSTSTYAVLCAPSIGFIRPYLALAREIIDQIGLDKTVRTQRISTTQQLFKVLWRQPKTFYLSSEWGILLQFAKRQPAGNIEQTLTVMSEAWDSSPLAADADEIRIPGGGDADGQYLIRVPHLTILGALAHDQLAMALKLSEMGRGALEQIQYWILDEEEFEEIDPDDMRSGPFPKDLIGALRAFATPVDTGNLSKIALPDQIPFRKTAVFCDLIKPFLDPLSAIPLSTESRPLGISARIIVRREATTLAFFADPDRFSQSVTIQPEFLRHAVDSEARRLRKLLDRFAALSSEDGKLSPYEKVLDFITAKKATGAGDRALRQYCKPYRNLSDDKRDDLIKQLILDGVIVEIAPTSKPGARRKTPVYVARAFVEESA